MTGNDDHSAPGAAPTATEPKTTAPTGWLSRFTGALTRRPVRYLAVDGGSGAQALAALAGQSPQLHAVSTPRHADIMMVAGPINERLAPAVAELARALPRPAHALVLDAPNAPNAPNASPGVTFPGQVPIEHILRNVTHVPADADAAVAALHLDTLLELTVSDAYTIEPQTIATPPAQQREIATELAVLSLGPLQPFTAGPLRLWLVCDGEQVLSCQVEAGYAARGVAEAMLGADWQAGAELARQLDPLAPIACQLVYVQALEQLQQVQVTQRALSARLAAVAIERAVDHLWWATRFFRLLDAPMLATRAYTLATTATALATRLWPEPPARWIVPQGAAPQIDATARSETERLADTVATFTRNVRGNRLLRLRTAGIGAISDQRLREARVAGPNLMASMRGAGDAQSRLVTRLDYAAADLLYTTHSEAGSHNQQGAESAPERRAPLWDAPAGEASTSIAGSRGRLGVRLVSEGGERPSLVEWRRPSAALLALLPEALAGQKLADAEIIIASLDLAMAEADG